MAAQFEGPGAAASTWVADLAAAPAAAGEQEAPTERMLVAAETAASHQRSTQAAGQEAGLAALEAVRATMTQPQHKIAEGAMGLQNPQNP